MNLRKWQDLDLDCSPPTGEVAVRRPSPHPAPRPTPRRPVWTEPVPEPPSVMPSAEAEVFAAFPLQVIEQDPILAGAQVWTSADAEVTPIGWQLAQEQGLRIGGYWMALWALTQERNALAAEMAAL